jgi:CheY-like chemotaxis protein
VTSFETDADTLIVAYRRQGEPSFEPQRSSVFPKVPLPVCLLNPIFSRGGGNSECYRVEMVRPCFLVIDREFPGSISTRKLVIETAKFNVITSYSAQEALETLKTFPAMHGVVLDSEVAGMPCESLVNGLKSINATIPIIAVCGPGDHPCTNADYQLESFEPRVLLELLRKLLLAQTSAIEKREEELHREQ